MLGLFLTLVFASNYFLCVSGDIPAECYDQEREACYHIEKPKGFPSTPDELMEVCRTVKELANCILPVREKCSDDLDDVKRFRDIIDYLHQVCDEDSEIFQVISGKLQCIESSAGDAFESCFRAVPENQTEELFEQLMLQFEQTHEREMNDVEKGCLYGYWYESCPSIKIGVKCGFEVGVAVKDVLNQIEYIPECADEIRGELSPLFDVLEIAILESSEEVDSPSEEHRRKRRFASPFHLFR